MIICPVIDLPRLSYEGQNVATAKQQNFDLAEVGAATSTERLAPQAALLKSQMQNSLGQ